MAVDRKRRAYAAFSRLPAVGVLAAVVFLVLSTARYPGGYDWARHYISTLFSPVTTSGSPNPSRPLAIVGMAFLSTSLAALFQRISDHAGTPFHRKTIQIAGIGSMVYGLFTVTMMHDLMVTISLAFFLTAMGAVLHMLFSQRDIRLFTLGLLCLAILLSTAVMYYGHVLLVLLPVAQKLSFVTCIGWLFAVQAATGSTKPAHSQTR